MELQIQNPYQSRYALQMQSLTSPQFYSTPQYQTNHLFPSNNTLVVPIPYQAMPLAQSIPQQVSSQQYFTQHVNTPFLVQNYSQPIQQSSNQFLSSNPFLPQPPQLKPTYQPILNDVFPQKSSSLVDDSSLEMVNIKKKEDEVSSNTITKKCLNCGIYYSEHLIQDVPNPCHYHPGNYMTTYQSPYISGASVGYWTCCKGAQKSLGCTKTKHKEDPVTTELQKLFGSPNQSVTAPPARQQESTSVGLLVDWGSETDTTTSSTQSSNKSNNKTKPVDYDKRSRDTKYISHYVNDSDTLTGLALKYRISVAAIRKVNRITVDDIRAYSRLLIPKDDSYTDKSGIHEDEIEECDESDMTEEEKKLKEKRSIHQFMKRAGTSEKEAKYYLGMHDYSLKKAMEELKDDIEFERKTPFRSVARKCK